MRQERARATARRHRIKMAVAAISTAVLLVPLAACGESTEDNDPDNKVSVCHFDGHEGDFVVDDTEGDCETRGGMILLVDDDALGGHDIGG